METDKNKASKIIEIEPSNKKNLMRILGVSLYVLNHYIEALQPILGLPNGTIFSARQVLLLINQYGLKGKFQFDAGKSNSDDNR